MSAEARRRDLARESRALESAPPPTRGEPGEFKANCRSQARILSEMRAFKAEVVRLRRLGAWPPPPGPVRVRKQAKGPAPYGLITRA